MFRRLAPPSIKLAARLARRWTDDLCSGHRRRFAQPNAAGRPEGQTFGHTLRLTQPIFNATTELSRINKIHNMKIAAARIEALVVEPGRIFSFYRAVGRPGRAQHFRKGINIIDGRVVEDYGGGLCQLSSIIYHSSLRAGLEILERWNHSVDLYQDTPRYTPLGADATVFYGYKDLRVLNASGHPIRFRFDIGDAVLTCSVDSAGPLQEHPVVFETVHDDERTVRVVTRRDGHPLSVSNYLKSRR